MLPIDSSSTGPQHEAGVMKIALLATGLRMGGAENQVVSLADRFASLGHAVLVIALTGDAVLSPSSPSVRVACLRMTKTPAGFLDAYRRARRLLRVFGPDVVHSHMVHANLFARLLRLAVPMPRLICTAHSCNEGGALRMWAYRLTDRLADITTNVSRDAVATFIRSGAVLPHKTGAVHNGIDCERFRFDAAERARVRRELNLPDDIQALLAVGRITAAKDYPNLLRAYAAVLASRSDCVLLIAGSGEEQAACEALAAKLRIDRKVRFLGMRRDVPELMSAADIFVLSSAWEGLPLAVGEAIACERVVVATDAGGVREWLDDTGRLVPVRDSAALAAALLRALALSPAEKTAQGRAARARLLKRHSLDAAAVRWLQIYRGNFAAHG